MQAARGWSDAGEARSDERFIRWMNRVTRPEDRVVACPPLHPIDRFDTFFVSMNTFDVAGFDTERTLARLPRLRGYTRAARYREELEVHPPAMVVVWGDRRMVPLPSRQFGVLTEYLGRNGYVDVRLGTVVLALRPDCYERARRDGLLKSSSGLSVAPGG